jgi:hypothetical protein
MPLPGVEIELRDEAGHPSKFSTGPDGTVRPPVEPGKWTVRLSLTGFQPVSRVVEVRSGERCTVEGHLRLDGHATVVTVAWAA